MSGAILLGVLSCIDIRSCPLRWGRGHRSATLLQSLASGRLIYGWHGQACSLLLNANRAFLDLGIGAGHARRKTTLEPTPGDLH